MNILGISAHLCDSSAALIKGGELVGAIEEEKLVQKKHTGELPVHAIRFLLKKADLDFSQIDHVAFFFKPFRGLHHRFFQILRYLPGSLGFYGSHGGAWWSMVRVRQELNQTFDLKSPHYHFHFINHHLSHASSSFFLSNFRDAAVMTVDGVGEWESTVLWTANENRLTPLQWVNYPHSLGYLYASVTQHLGFKPNSGEGKVMGLASYGKDRYADQFRKILKIQPDGRYDLDLSYFDYYRNASSITNTRRWVSEKFVRIFGPEREPESKIDARHEDIAASLQLVLNEVMIHMTNHLYDRTKKENLCLAGGVALNSVANGLLFKQSKFKHIFIQPAAGDGGASLGAALYVTHGLLKKPRIDYPEKVFLGPEFSDGEILSELQKRKVNFQKVDPVQEGAKLLAEGKIIGWFHGRAEFGPRALGNRSILADPRKAQMKDIINARVKFREHFRPFAPAILEEKLSEYFDFHYPSPVMLLVYDVLPEKRKVIPAVTHVDGTGRVQSVSRKDNPLYYDLIYAFFKATGVPVILNTSLNIRGKPIVCTPEHAIDCFNVSDMDALIIGEYVVTK